MQATESDAAKCADVLGKKLIQMELVRTQITRLLCIAARQRYADQLRAERRRRQEELERKEREKREERERAAYYDKRWRELRANAIGLSLAWALILSGIITLINARY